MPLNPQSSTPRHPIPDLESLDALPNFLHDSGSITAEDGGEGGDEEASGLHHWVSVMMSALPLFYRGLGIGNVHRIQRRRNRSHEDLPRPRDGLVEAVDKD
jgi:hypothetical protein